MVATPHCGARSLSIDLRTDEISSTGGHRFFAQSGTGTWVTSGPGVSSTGLPLTGAGVVGTGVGYGLTGGVRTTFSSACLASP